MSWTAGASHDLALDDIWIENLVQIRSYTLLVLCLLAFRSVGITSLGQPSASNLPLSRTKPSIVGELGTDGESCLGRVDPFWLGEELVLGS